MYTEFGQKIASGNAFSELGSIGTPLTTNGSAQCLDHLSVNQYLPLVSSIIAHECLNLPCTFLTGLTWTHCESESTWVESESESESVRPESESTALESESTEVESESESESTRVESESGLESGLGLGLNPLSPSPSPDSLQHCYRTPLTTNESAQYLDHLSIKQLNTSCKYIKTNRRTLTL